MASVYRRTYKDKKSGKIRKCKTYTIELSDGRRLKGYTDKFASQQKAAAMEKAIARGEEDCLDLYAEHKARPLSQHVTDYLAELRTLGRDDMYVYNCEKRLAKLIAACQWRTLKDITADSFCQWRESGPKFKNKPIGPTTKNQYLETVREFCQWCVRRRRMADNPVKSVDKVDETSDVRRKRRAATPEQLSRLLANVPAHHWNVYYFILSTGLRRQEVEDLIWADARLDLPKPILKLRAKATKARRADSLPLRADVVTLLRSMRGSAGDADKVFPQGVPTMDEHRAYLKAAGIEWKDADDRQLDLHALRHTYNTLLAISGVPLEIRQQLMRHTDAKLTAVTYLDERAFEPDLAQAVEKLPLPSASQPATTVANSAAVVATWAGQCQNDADRLVGRLAGVSTSEGLATTVTDSVTPAAEVSQTLENASVAQQKTPIGSDGGVMRHLGLEPRTR